MLDSLRARLLLWYALILSLVVIAFGSTVCYLYWRSLVLDIDGELQSAHAAISRALRPAASGGFDFELPAQYRASEFGERLPHTYYAIWSPTGELIDRSDPDTPLPATRTAGMHNRSGHREMIGEGTGGSVILVARDLSEAHRRVGALASTVGLAGGAVLLLSLTGGWFLAGRALAPVARISRAASAMARGDLSARIAVEHTENELEQVALALNDGFDRLRMAADAQRQFTADASHELRTPLATLRAQFDYALKRPRSAAEYVGILEACRRAGDRMSRIVDELLTLARGDSARMTMQQESVALAALIQDVVALLGPLAEEKGVRVTASLEPALVTGDAARLSDVFGNLLKNAIEYNRQGGEVAVTVRREGPAVSVRVKDSGIGISADELPRIFDRFYRADKARTRKVGGAGLGLAIARRVVEEHGGAITCHSEVDRGTEVIVRLPEARHPGLEAAAS